MIIAEQHIKALLLTFLCVMFWVSLIMGVSGQVERGKESHRSWDAGTEDMNQELRVGCNLDSPKTHLILNIALAIRLPTGGNLIRIAWGTGQGWAHRWSLHYLNWAGPESQCSESHFISKPQPCLIWPTLCASVWIYIYLILMSLY